MQRALRSLDKFDLMAVPSIALLLFALPAEARYPQNLYYQGNS